MAILRRILLAFQVFFLTLFRAAVAEQVAQMLAGAAPAAEPTPAPQPKPAPSPAPKPPARSEAITLLAALQREARFVDFVQESLAGYTRRPDRRRRPRRSPRLRRRARRGCSPCGRPWPRRKATEVEVPAGFDPGRWRLTGNVAGEPPFRGRLVHPGWEATICELPTWSGSAAAARIVAPAEVELR